MYAATVDKKQLKKTLSIIAAVVVLGAAAVVIGGRVLDNEEKVGAPQDIAAGSAEQREEFLVSQGLGYMQASSVTEVTVPEEFDERFESYNTMLKQSGFDLEPLKGESVQKCTYVVTNRPDLGSNVSAVLLVREGVLVAAHLICSDDGSFYPINQPLPDAQQTILPAEQQPAAEVSEDAYPSE